MTMSILTRKLWRDIYQRLGRFVAIVLIIFLGVLLFVGVRGIGPALKDSAITASNQQRLSDLQVISSAGFTKADQRQLEAAGDVAVSRVKYRQVQTKSGQVVNLYAQPTQQNRPMLVSGRLAKSDKEIVLDQRARTKFKYRLGQTVQLAKTSGFKAQQLKIVGFAHSPQYIDSTMRGAATMGDGTVAFFAYAKSAVLQLPVATMLAIRGTHIDHQALFDQRYTDQVDRLKQKFTPILNRQLAAKQKKQQQQVSQLTQTLAQLPASQVAPRAQLTANLAQLKAQSFQLQVQTHDDLPGFSAYGDTADRISAIANVFPVFFFLIAALITFTTITRMVEEARGQLGILKALGYTNGAIARNYWLYALLTAILGTTFGVVVGSEFLPRFVLNLYTMMYIFSKPVINYQWGTIALAVIFALISTLGAAIIVIWQQLRVGPAALMLPKAPRSAKRILMERWTWLWRQLSFNQKVSYRNLFRFKSRLIMTVIGIAGGLGLLLTGFGIRDSITATGTRQINDILTYQASVRTTNQADTAAVARDLRRDRDVTQVLPMSSSLVTVRANKKQVNNVNLNQVQNSTQLGRFVHMTTTRGDTIHLPQTGVIMSQKMAGLLHVKQGDTVQYKVGSQTKRIKVAGVMANYVGDVMYMRGTSAINTYLVKQPKLSSAAQQQFSKRAMKIPGVLNVSLKTEQLSSISAMTKQLNPVILIFILLSGTLSLVVLYNLTNINISERLRELSTIKVLGFFDREVTAYIIRENIVLTVVGIILGYGVGNALTAYILQQAETPQVVFPLAMTWSGYAWSTGLMLGFTAIVMWMTHRKLQHIDMLDALKANE